jgi:hypothetical protein
MKPSETRKVHYASVMAAIIVIAGAVLVGWWIGHHNSKNDAPSSSGSQQNTTNTTTNSSINSLVSYTLPAGWSEASCPSAAGIIYIALNGTSSGCSAPVKIYMDSKNSTDCQQLKPSSTEGVKKHTCSSLYIDGHKSLKALTDINNTSTADYFVNTGKGIVAVEYTYTNANDSQAGFDQLASSIKVKS